MARKELFLLALALFVTFPLLMQLACGCADPIGPTSLTCRGDTSLHVAVKHYRNESYRYLVHLVRCTRDVERKSEWIGEPFQNRDGRTPVQLAAVTGGRCTQARAPDESPAAHASRGVQRYGAYFLRWCSC